jgi:LmbE family N-acetylglucosaminyl deacetylase
VFESDIIPYHVSSPPGERIVVLAPHPDDETLGCGGTIRLLRKSGKKVKVIFLTSGDQADPSNKLSHIPSEALIKTTPQCSVSELSHIPSPLRGEGAGEGAGMILHPPLNPLPSREGRFDKGTLFSPPLNKGGYRGVQGGSGGFSDQSHFTKYALLREREAIKALKILGVSDYEFLRFPDRKLDLHFESLLGRLLDILKQYAADIIYSPSMIELNPDHRATAAMAMEIQKTVMNTDAPSASPPPRGGRARVGVTPLAILFYEVTTPLRPNVLIDISSTRNRKRKAVKSYKSQLGITDYLKYITALNEVRALTVREAGAVEAFWLVESPLRTEEITAWLAYQASVSKNPHSCS